MPENLNPDTNFRIISKRSPETEVRKAEMPNHIGEANEMVDPIPCPFCGEPLQILAGPSHSTCNNCGACGPYEGHNPCHSGWNRRTPEPGTSVVRWVRYDGRPETLPKEGKPVRLARGECEIVSLFEGYWVDTSDTYAGDPAIGILWFYLPEPPAEER